ncbi:M16 family metallopeptidase [Undibacterium umbellatum]|uniref:Insulinase family protein n=1 Tax=Undibacterium umbellatum TaxID=2762300 RepID=A0ABR6Z8Y9_9BURK|nr:pitrilysin family protein [Undibacterium umbellatum]MBC3907637.1 insulinase family protein [Undibacterium umbellatum]
MLLIFTWQIQVCSLAAESEKTLIIESDETQARFVRTIEDVQEYQLKNGLQILLMPNFKSSLYVVNLVYRTGSAGELEGESGLSHMFEHFVAQRSSLLYPRLAEDLKVKHINRLGITSSDFTYYRTNYIASRKELEWVLALDAERMSHFDYDEDSLKTVLQEVYQEMDDKVSNHEVSLLVNAAIAMRPGQGSGRDVLGRKSDLANINLAKLRAFWQSHYRPDNASLIVAGNFDVAEMLQLIQARFASIPKPEAALLHRRFEPIVQSSAQEISISYKRTAPGVISAYRVAPVGNSDFAAVYLLAGMMEERRLAKKSADDTITEKISAFVTPYMDDSILVFRSLLPYGSGNLLPDAKSRLLSLEKDILEHPFTQVELDRAKAKMAKGFQSRMNDPERYVTSLPRYIVANDWSWNFTVRDMTEKISLEKMQNLAQQWLREQNRTMAFLREDEAAK